MVDQKDLLVQTVYICAKTMDENTHKLFILGCVKLPVTAIITK
jgi:hypothetical protein